MDVPQQNLFAILDPVAMDDVNGEARIDEVQEEIVVGKTARKLRVAVISLELTEL